jgi:uncharacterized membrane protein (UPF0127 family)
VLSLALAVVLAAATPSPAPPHRATIVVHAPKADLALEVARTEAQREFGLMNRTSLAPHGGMIFVFASDGPIEFWMKDTLIPLDMVFVGADGTVRKIFRNVPVLAPQTPDNKIPLESGNAKYVIELAGGDASNEGLVEGTKLDLAAVPPVLPY